MKLPSALTADAESTSAGDQTVAQLDAAEALAGFGRWTWDGASLQCSAGMLGILGVPPQPTMPEGRALLRRVPPASRPALFALLRQALAGSQAEAVELPLIGLDGGTRAILMTVRTGASPAGTTLWGICQDVTSQRRIHAALDQSESRWHIALASARQGVWDSDVETGIVYHSRTWRALRGMDPEGDPRDSQESWLTRVHPDDIGSILAQIARQHAAEEPRVAFEYRERHCDGHYMWISSMGAPVEWFPDGRPKRIIGTDTDITQRKQAEDEMARLSRRLELALHVSKVGVFESNLITGELFWDSRVREMYGIQLDGSPIGPTTWEATLHPDDAAAARRQVEDAVRNQSSFQSEFRIIRPDGEIRTIRTDGIWHRDSDGTPRMLGTNWDVTDEVNAKRDLERAKSLAEARNHELEIAKASIEHNALHDTLTGLPNRRFLDRELAARCARNATSVALLHIDLDRFKQINDTLGHVAGDAMLIHAAQLLRANLEAGDFVARVGGDEFIVVCSSGGDRRRLIALANAIIEQMRRPVPYEGHYCRFGASIGIATQLDDDVDPKRLLVNADIALYRAKAHGKNAYEFFTAALRAESVDAKRLADDILRGIEQAEFQPYYQPLFDAQTHALVGVEALARWNHPSQGTLPPARFLKVAEDINAVTTIDRLILERALADFDCWAAAGLAIPGVSVNVSFRRLHDQHLIENLRGLNIKPGVLSFELLESILFDEMDDIVAWNLECIRDLGIAISIDDFGTGHASVVSLLKLAPAHFKIDRQFLKTITVSAGQRRLVGSLIDIGKSLGIKVVAEGVETLEQANILRDLGCDILQGFVFARPMSSEALQSFVAHRRARKAS